MKKLFAFLLAAMLVLSLAACGENTDKPSGGTDKPGTSQGDNSGGNSNGGVAALENVSLDNWQTVTKEVFGVDITVPDGWTVTKVSKALKSGIYITLNPQNANEASVVDFLESVFTELKGVTTGDITGHYNDLAYTSMKDAWEKGVDAFNMPINETKDGYKKMYFSYSDETRYDENMERYWEELRVYLDLKNKN